MIPELEEEIMADESFLEKLRRTRETLYEKAGGTMENYLRLANQLAESASNPKWELPETPAKRTL